MPGSIRVYRVVLAQHLFCPVDDFADVLKRLYVSDFELQAEFHFDGDHEVDVIERIPVWNVFAPSFHSQQDRVVEQNIAKNADEYRENLVAGHRGPPTRTM